MLRVETPSSMHLNFYLKMASFLFYCVQVLFFKQGLIDLSIFYQVLAGTGNI